MSSKITSDEQQFVESFDVPPGSVVLVISDDHDVRLIFPQVEDPSAEIPAHILAACEIAVLLSDEDYITQLAADFESRPREAETQH